MHLEELAEKLGIEIHEYQKLSRSGTTLWICEIREIFVGEYGFVMSVIGFGTIRADARKNLVKKLRGKRVSPGISNTTISIDVPNDLEA